MKSILSINHIYLVLIVLVSVYAIYLLIIFVDVNLLRMAITSKNAGFTGKYP